jgi:cell division protein FtsN
MSRDYKSKSMDNSSGKNGYPIWMGIVIGLFLGWGSAIGIALYVTHLPNPFINKMKLPGTETTISKNDAGKNIEPPKPDTKTTKTTEKPRFDFYKILPGNEEPVSEQELKRAKQAAANNPAKEEKLIYYLQAGAFQKQPDADNLKAKLALLGLEANIQTIDLPEKGGIWHRVRLGPYNKLDEMDKTRGVLAQNSIESALIKMRQPSTN